MPQLQERQKWRTKEPNLQVGDLVLLETKNQKQFLWPVARVIEIIKGRDGLVRTVKVRTKVNKELLKRGIHEIYPLEACREGGTSQDVEIHERISGQEGNNPPANNKTDLGQS